MQHPRSKLRSLRPSPAMLVAVTALFFALAGAGYAAAVLPAGSVGNSQLQNNSISNAKLRNNSVGFAKMRHNAIHYFNINPHSVGTVRIVPTQVQERVKGTCATGQTISAVAQNGSVTCVSSGAAEFDSGTAANVAVTSPTNAVQITKAFALDKGSSYLAQAAPYITVTPDVAPSTQATPDSEAVNVSCTLSVGSTTLTRNATIDVTQSGSAAKTPVVLGNASIPMTLAVPAGTSPQIATLSCVQTSSDLTTPTTKVTPTVDAQGTVYALQTASNTSAGTVATPAK